jgi:hypothetical protein
MHNKPLELGRLNLIMRFLTTCISYAYAYIQMYIYMKYCLKEIFCKHDYHENIKLISIRRKIFVHISLINGILATTRAAMTEN